jgi:hypothetical protein
MDNNQDLPEKTTTKEIISMIFIFIVGAAVLCWHFMQ